MKYIRYLQFNKSKILDLLLSNFKSYSPDFEDFILYYIFYDIPNGFYIDVGAHDPNKWSVTKSFYDRGWHGINIDPLPYKYPLFEKYRRRDINLQIAAGNKKGNATLNVRNDCSSMLYTKNENNTNIINIKVDTLSNICRKYVPIELQIHFCKIDVERAEKLVLLGYDFINYRPKIFCIESLFNKRTNSSEYKEWEYILTKNDYGFIFKYGRNRYYYDKRQAYLKTKFNLIDFYINKYNNKYKYRKKK